MFVKSINFSTTEFMHVDGRLMFIPNQLLAQNTLISFKRSKLIGFEVVIFVDIEIPIEKIYKLAEEMRNFQEQDTTVNKKEKKTNNETAFFN